MKKGAPMFLVGGIWGLVRFVAVFATSATSLVSVEDSHLNLLWLGAPALILSALFFATAYHPSRAGAYLPILRIGLAVSVLTDVIVVVTGSFDWTPAAILQSIAGGRILFLLAFAVLVVDLVALSLLLSVRRPPDRGPGPVKPRDQAPIDEAQLPEYDPTDLDQ